VKCKCYVYSEYTFSLRLETSISVIVESFFLFVFFFGFLDRVSLYSPGCPGTHSVDQAGLELRNLPASASRVLGLEVCATTPGLGTANFNIFSNQVTDFLTQKTNKNSALPTHDSYLSRSPLSAIFSFLQ
jgi:hypothetical protein